MPPWPQTCRWQVLVAVGVCLALEGCGAMTREEFCTEKVSAECKLFRKYLFSHDKPSHLHVSFECVRSDQEEKCTDASDKATCGPSLVNRACMDESVPDGSQNPHSPDMAIWSLDKMEEWLTKNKEAKEPGYDKTDLFPVYALPCPQGDKAKDDPGCDKLVIEREGKQWTCHASGDTAESQDPPCVSPWTPGGKPCKQSRTTATPPQCEYKANGWANGAGAKAGAGAPPPGKPDEAQKKEVQSNAPSETDQAAVSSNQNMLEVAKTGAASEGLAEPLSSPEVAKTGAASEGLAEPVSAAEVQPLPTDQAATSSKQSKLEVPPLPTAEARPAGLEVGESGVALLDTFAEAPLKHRRPPSDLAFEKGKAARAEVDSDGAAKVRVPVLANGATPNLP